MKRILPLFALAFAATMLGFFGTRYLRKQGNREKVDVLEAYFEPYPVPMSAPLDPARTHWISGLVNYNQKSYGQAEQEWRASLQHKEMPAFMTRFYLGQALMAQGKHADALAYFKRVLQGKNDIHPLARWYLGLAYVGAGDTAQARMHLQILAEEGEYRSRDAGAVLEEL